MSCDQSYLVRVTTIPPATKDGVFIYSYPAGPTLAPVLVKNFSITSASTMCFQMDASQNGYVIGIDSCPNVCTSNTWSGSTLSVNVVPPSMFNLTGVPLLLKVTSPQGAGYTATTNDPRIDGGRPIIRYPPYIEMLIIGAIVIVLLAIGFKFRERIFPSQGDGLA